MTMRLLRGHAGESGLIAVLIGGVYAWGACPTIYVGDSGELVAAVHTLGIPHPSGYPLFVLLGKLWTLIVPFGSVAYRMSLFSAACTAAACGGLYWVARRNGLRWEAAAFAALAAAFAPSVWKEANVQRVYALNALFVVAVIAAVFEWHRTRHDHWLVAALGLCGLGASNHTIMGVFGLLLTIYAFAVERSLLGRPRTLLLGGTAFAAGLLPYLYLPIRSRMNPRLDWGNPETLDGFLGVLLRRGFWERRWIEGPGDLFVIAADYGSGLGEELYWVGAALAVLGLARGRAAKWPVGWLVVLMAGNLLAVANHGSRTDIFVWHRYYIPSYIAAALLAGLGVHALSERWKGFRYAALVIPLLALSIGFPRFDRSRYTVAEDFSRSLLRSLPPGAHLTANDDNILFVLIYLKLVEGVRPDVDLILAGVGGAELPPLRFKPGSEDLFLTHHPNWGGTLEVVPIGLVFQAMPPGRPLPPTRIPIRELDGENDPSIPKDYLTQNLIGHLHYMLGITFEHRDWVEAKREFAAAQAAASHNDVLHYNLGLIYRRNGLPRDALRAFERSHEINPRGIATKSEVRASDRVAEVRAEVEELDAIEGELLRSWPDQPGLESAEYHERMALELERLGASLPAYGHRLKALERRAGL